jgi:hypothetical protein
MFEPRASIWDPVHTALTDSTTGVVTAFQDRVRFGFSLYRGSTTTHLETDPACATILSVPFAIDNRAAIETLYADASDDYSGMLWETPTGHAIRRAADDLALVDLDPPGRKYILLVTDGNPNTCQVLDPQCGQDQSIAAAQYARTLGITLLAAGIGDLVQRGATGCPMSARCGTNHLQDLANAGTGRAVQPPSDDYKYEQCNPNQMLSATYATPPGTATYYSGTNESEYRTAFTAALNSILSGTLP